ncbi:MAG: PASTA domain-containing protein, partial [Jatrophihabitantaceae bacterium]
PGTVSVAAPADREGADGAATDVLRRHAAPSHDTAVVPGSGRQPRRDPPPPPVVTPPVVTPPARRKARSPQMVRRRRAMIVVLVLLLLGLAAGYGGWWFATGRYSHVPKVAGDTVSVAKQELEQAGYQVVTAPAPLFSETVGKNLVVMTKPGPDARVARGQTVTIVLSAGPERFMLPKDLANKTPAEVRSQLSALPVRIASALSPETSETVTTGRVTRISPAAGTPVKRDQRVTIFVSTGKPIVAIPHIDPGTPYDQAVATLKKVGFVTKRVEGFSDTIAKDGVISITPNGQARKASTITLTVSKGPRLVSVPDIATGTPASQARTLLQHLGFRVRVVKHFGGFLDEVVGIDPPSGTLVVPGSLITLDTV